MTGPIWAKWAATRFIWPCEKEACMHHRLIVGAEFLMAEEWSVASQYAMVARSQIEGNGRGSFRWALVAAAL